MVTPTVSASPAGKEQARAGRFSVRGLYAVTPDEPDTAALALKVRQALRGGARMVQYRNKSAGVDLRREQAAALLQLCRMAGVPLIINDDLELAVDLDAEGLHLGRGDGDLRSARRRLGVDKLLGASCYDKLELAIAAQNQGASYVAFGAAFSTTTKPEAVRAPLSLYGEARARLGVPVVAIGGITLRNAGKVMLAGAAAVAVISALFDAPDIERRAREFSQILGR